MVLGKQCVSLFQKSKLGSPPGSEDLLWGTDKLTLYGGRELAERAQVTPKLHSLNALHISSFLTCHHRTPRAPFS